MPNKRVEYPEAITKLPSMQSYQRGVKKRRRSSGPSRSGFSSGLALFELNKRSAQRFGEQGLVILVRRFPTLNWTRVNSQSNPCRGPH